MTCKDVTKEIDGRAVFCRQWPATKALEMKAKLIKIGGEAVFSFVEGKCDLPSIMAMEMKADHTELIPLMKEFITSVRVDNKEIMPNNFDQFYKGDLWFANKVFAFACEVQYKSFFEQGLAEIQE